MSKTEWKDSYLITIIERYNKTDAPVLISDKDLSDWGIDSIDYINLILDMEAEFNIEFPDDAFLSENFTILSTMKKIIVSLLND